MPRLPVKAEYDAFGRSIGSVVCLDSTSPDGAMTVSEILSSLRRFISHTHPTSAGEAAVAGAGGPDTTRLG